MCLESNYNVCCVESFLAKSATLNINKRTQFMQTKYFYVYLKKKINVFVINMMFC